MAPPIDGGNPADRKEENYEKTFTSEPRGRSRVSMAPPCWHVTGRAKEDFHAYLADPALEGILYGIKSGKVTSDPIEIEPARCRSRRSSPRRWRKNTTSS